MVCALNVLNKVVECIEAVEGKKVSKEVNETEKKE